MREVDNKYKCIPFWSWNDELDEESLIKQIEWMKDNGVGGFFMHARAGLKTEYLGDKWFKCVDACIKKASELNMEAYAYDENGWPSGFAGRKLLTDIENHDMTIDHKFGPYDEKADISYDLSTDKLIKATSGDNCLNLYFKYSTATADILNPEVVGKFINLTHEQYLKNDSTKTLKGFFTDEPQYFRWGTPYTKMVKEYFSEYYHENVLDRIGLLFVEKEGYQDFRYKYWYAMQHLMLKNFSKQIYDWCTKNGYKLTGHYVEENSIGWQLMCCGGVMPFYEYEHIPGIDWLGRPTGNELAPKQLGSVSAQLGKKQSICEMFACAGWDVTPKELKHIAEFTYIDGVNLCCQHLLPYKEHGQRKRDYPSHFSYVNPWINKNFKTFNDYFSVLGEILSNSTEIVNVGVLHPNRSAYFDYKRYLESEQFGIADIDNSFAELINLLSAKNIPHHFIDETILENHGSVKENKFICGNCAYEYLIIPKIYTMGKHTKDLISEYVKNGGKILLYDKCPEYLEGEKYSYDFLKSNITLAEIRENQRIKCSENKNIKLTHRLGDDSKEFIYIVNLGGKTSVDLKVDKISNFLSYDIMEDTYKEVSGSLEFNEYESYILYPIEKDVEPKEELETIELIKDYDVLDKVNNYLTLDFIKYSLDGINYNEPLHHMGVFSELLKKRYAGKVYLKYEFNVQVLPKNAKALIESMNILNVYVNGEIIQKEGSALMEEELFYYDVAKFLKLGLNEIVLEIDYYQKDDAYYAIFGDNVTEGLKNCLAYDTDIEAIYIIGDFGVFGEFSDDNKEDVIYGQNFYIGEQKNHIRSLVKDGFPFFRGNITLKQNIYLKNKNVKLKFSDRFHLIEVYVNKNKVGLMMFDNEIDISKFTKQGENEIELILTVGNRNLLGPLHSVFSVDAGIGPDSFERMGSWTKGKSSIFRDEYQFVKTII